MIHWLFSTLFLVFVIGSLAIIVHELAHIAVAMRLGVKIKKVGVCWKGVYIIRESGNDVQNLLITLAGPAINLLFVLVCWYPTSWLSREFFLANFCVFGVNALPFYRGSDGNRAWKCAVKLWSK